jgi:SAM-dependent methyltransferase
MEDNFHLLHTMLKKLLKKNPYVHRLAKYMYRTFYKSARLYFLFASPKPLSEWYGMDRGTPIDRFFIEMFLEKNKGVIKGTCLELLNNNYTTKYGGDTVRVSDILDIEADNICATIIGDLRKLSSVSDDTYDCIILTQVLQFIDDVDAALSECYRILRPGGTILITLPAISRCDCTSGADGDYWRFTTAGAKYLIEKVFNSQRITINSYGNARTGLYFYAGLAQEDVSKKVFSKNDKNFPTVITIVATK